MRLEPTTHDDVEIQVHRSGDSQVLKKQVAVTRVAHTEVPTTPRMIIKSKLERHSFDEPSHFLTIIVRGQQGRLLIPRHLPELLLSHLGPVT